MDPRSLTTNTPRTRDGRAYPEHLRAYEAFDDVILPLLDEHVPLTFDDLSSRIEDPRAAALLPRWIASARWRDLIVPRDDPSHGPRRYVLSSRGHTHLPHAA
jgi:hypothetical protein